MTAFKLEDLDWEPTGRSALSPQQIEQLKNGETIKRIKAGKSVKRYWGYPITYAQTFKIVED